MLYCDYVVKYNSQIFVYWSHLLENIGGENPKQRYITMSICTKLSNMTKLHLKIYIKSSNNGCFPLKSIWPSNIR